MDVKVIISEEDEPPSEIAAPSLISSLNDECLFGGGNAIHKLWPTTTVEQWKDWKWQTENRITSIEDLAALLNLKPYQIAKYKTLNKLFHFAITPYYLSLIDWYNPGDPIKKQCMPDLKELEFKIVGDYDPLEEEEDMQVPGLVHRYPDRVLAVVTNMCSMYCRHCTRKRVWHEGESTRSNRNSRPWSNTFRQRRRFGR